MPVAVPGYRFTVRDAQVMSGWACGTDCEAVHVPRLNEALGAWGFHTAWQAVALLSAVRRTGFGYVARAPW